MIVPVLHDYLIFSARDVAIQAVPIVEDNCGACPEPPNQFYLATALSPGAIYQLPPLVTCPLGADYHLGFNPLGPAGVVVLNSPALALLQQFRQPASLANGVRAMGSPSESLTAAERLVQLGLLEPVVKAYQPQQSAGQTVTAWLHVTNDCNLDCPYCFVDKNPEKMDLERGQQAVEAVYRSAVAQQFQRVKLKYAGGEATLNFPLVVALHQHAQKLAAKHKLGLDGVVLSNGVALSFKMIEAMKALDIRLMISLDGVGDFHDRQRPFVNGRGSFAHLERALDRLEAANFKPSISITLSNRNLEGLPAVIEYVLQRGLAFNLNFYRENECSASFGDLSYEEEQIIAAMRAAFDIIEANLPPYSLLGTILDLAKLDTPHARTCGVGRSYLVINQRGGIAKCHMELERTVTDINAADPLRLIQLDTIGIQNPMVDEKEGCRECDWRYWCAGGCPALTYRVTGRYDVKSPNCNIYKTLFPEILRLEGLRLLKYSGVLVA
jgi:uncharacterized protein